MYGYKGPVNRIGKSLGLGYPDKQGPHKSRTCSDRYRIQVLKSYVRIPECHFYDSIYIFAMEPGCYLRNYSSIYRMYVYL